MDEQNTPLGQSVAFKAETRQLLDILIHSLYKDREIFLRELISNASDALTRMDFEILTNRDVADQATELMIHITYDSENSLLHIDDTGIGMTSDEMIENLGTIAHSGARAFLANAQTSDKKNLYDLIGQFGVGFYSAFMVAEWIQVDSLSSKPGSAAASWYCTGSDTYSIKPSEKSGRGTRVTVKLKDDAKEYAQEYRLREIIRRHSEFIPFPIYLGEKKEQVNRQTAIWRQASRQLEKKDYDEFYKQLTLDSEPPLTYSHLVIDAPVQLYAILFCPGQQQRSIFSLRREDGIKLYARKVLIQEYCKDLLPEYFRFVQGVVDSEDIPLNVSRETIQSNRIMAQLKKLITTRIIDTLKELAKQEPEKYEQFWREFGRYVKEGVAIEQDDPQSLYPLLRFHTSAEPDTWTSLDDYTRRMAHEQKDIYYILGEDELSVRHSPHLEVIQRHNYEVLLLADQFVDPFMMVRLTKYNDFPLVNVASADLSLPTKEVNHEEAGTSLAASEWVGLIDRFKGHLGDKVANVRMTDRLSNSPARLVDSEGAPNQELQRVYRLLKEDFPTPQKILELNPKHPILIELNSIPSQDDLSQIIIDQIYEDALLMEGLHPNPVSMIERIQKIMEAALNKRS